MCSVATVSCIRILDKDAITSTVKRLVIYIVMVMKDQAVAWLLRLRIRHLEVFHMLVRTGSQSETAALMHISQPALSKWLRELEEQAGCALMERARPLRLPPTARCCCVMPNACWATASALARN